MDDQSGEMMDDFDRWAIRLLKLVAVVLLLILCWAAIAWWISPPPERRDIHAFAQIPEAESAGSTSVQNPRDLGRIEERGERYFTGRKEMQTMKRLI